MTLSHKDTGRLGTDYNSRIADQLLESALNTTGAVQIVGPKWCGKTTTAARQARQVLFLQDPDYRSEYQSIAQQKPSLLLRGEKPLLLDEWQDIPVLWDAVRFAVDRDSTLGQFILTGSSVPKEDAEIKHTGTGRFSKLVMRTMSLFESGESSGEVSLLDIINQEDIYSTSKLSKEDIAPIITRGGWPASVARNDDFSIQRAYDYVESIINSDISKVDGVEKNPNRVRLLMRSLARNESTEAAMTTIKANMAADDGQLSTNTIAVYLNALRRLYVLEEQPAWAPAVRSKVAMRTSPIRRYCDPSIPAALLGLDTEKLLNDQKTFGFFFESLCIRDLRIYSEIHRAKITHYKDERGLDCDAIIELPDGRWGAVEVKLGTASVDDASEKLLRIKEEVHSEHGGKASFLIVLTSEGLSYRRNDEVYVVPIGCLGP